MSMIGTIFAKFGAQIHRNMEVNILDAEVHVKHLIFFSIRASCN